MLTTSPLSKLDWHSLSRFNRRQHEAETSEAGSAWIPIANGRNDYLSDAQIQRTRMFSGIEPLWCQDKAVQESMGPVTDRLHEHLAPSDLAISKWRQKILAAVEGDQLPAQLPGRDPSTHQVRPVHFVMDSDADWRAEMEAQMHIKPTA